MVFGTINFFFLNKETLALTGSDRQQKHEYSAVRKVLCSDKKVCSYNMEFIYFCSAKIIFISNNSI